MPLLSGYALSNYPDIIAITETWAIADTPDGFYSLPGYNLYRTDRADKRGGGVMLFINDTIASSEVSCDHFDDFESLCIKISLSNDMSVGFLCVYRPPNISTDGDLHLVTLIDHFMELRHTYSIIVGDFNMPSINWKTLIAPSKFSPILKCISNHFMKQHITEPTRPCSSAILDLIFTTIDTNIHDISINECFGTSDHSIINFKILLPSIAVPTYYSPKRNYRKANWDIFSKFLCDTDRESVFANQNVDATWFKFKAVLNNALDASVPYKKRNSWTMKSNPKIRTALRYTRRCHQQFKMLNNKDSLLRLLHAKERLQDLVDKQIAWFEEQIVSSARQNPKIYWSYVKANSRIIETVLTQSKLEIVLLKIPSR